MSELWRAVSGTGGWRCRDICPVLRGRDCNSLRGAFKGDLCTALGPMGADGPLCVMRGLRGREVPTCTPKALGTWRGAGPAGSDQRTAPEGTLGGPWPWRWA